MTAHAGSIEHKLVVEVPGRPGRGSVTGSCACSLWCVSACIETLPGVFDAAASEARVRSRWPEHEREIPTLDAQFAAIEERARHNERDRRTARRLAEHDEETQDVEVC